MKKLNYFNVLFYFLSFTASVGAQAALSNTISGKDLLDGKTKEISLQKAKVGTVVVFLSSVCPCSKSHVSALNQLANSKGFAEKFSFVGVHSNADEDFEHSSEYFKESGISFPVIHDENSKIADEYEAFKTPHVFVISSSLKILYQGGVDDSRIVERAEKHYLRDALMKISNGEEPEEKNVRTLGCEIKRPG